jgi:LEA14-like dessication related protein
MYASSMRAVAWLPLVAVLACAKPAPPTLTPERVQLTALTPSRIELRVLIRAENPNTIDLVARNLTAAVRVAGKFDVGTVEIPVTTTLPAGRATKLDVPLSVKLNDIAPLAQLAMTSTSIPYTVEGTVGLGGDLVHVELPFTLTGSVPRDQVVQAALGAIPGMR